MRSPRTICPPPCRGQKVGYTDSRRMGRPSGFSLNRRSASRTVRNPRVQAPAIASSVFSPAGASIPASCGARGSRGPARACRATAAQIAGEMVRSGHDGRRTGDELHQLRSRSGRRPTARPGRAPPSPGIVRHAGGRSWPARAGHSMPPRSTASPRQRAVLDSQPVRIEVVGAGGRSPDTADGPPHSPPLPLYRIEEGHPNLRCMALGAERDPTRFWNKLLGLPRVSPPKAIRRLLKQSLPRGAQDISFSHRIAGVGSLGRPRYLATALAMVD